MQAFRFTFPRRLWRDVHLWIGLGSGLLIAPIGLSGALLVFAGDLDRRIDPALYAVSGSGVEQEAGTYLAHAVEAVPGGRATRLRLPTSDGSPVTVLLRAGPADGQAAPRDQLRVVFLDPPSGRVLGVRDLRGSFVGIVHSFHANLLVADFSGRQIVGWAGLGLLTLALTGIWLWWPRNGGFLRGLRWRRGPATVFNLHHMMGFWISVPLAIMALTGATLSFPQQARAVIGMFAEFGPRPEPGGAPMRRPGQSATAIAAIALQAAPRSRLAAITLPSEQSKVWRVQLTLGDDDTRTVVVDDATAIATLLPSPVPGDAFAALLRRLHEGDHHGPVWQTMVLLAGLFPVVLVVTGVLMWLRRRSHPSLPESGRVARAVRRPETRQDTAIEGNIIL